ncbi:MAG TPA: hypothetical protein VFX58_14360 [Chitinophagaceae bacterium]|nr:hypothetical protein [Chitinophagaceae bacterium]
MKVFLLFTLLLNLSCNIDQQKNTALENATTKDTAAVSEKPQLEQKVVKEEPVVLDTGQTWFTVNITKNDSAYINYEGSWPVFLESNNSATLQLSRSKNIMSVTDILTLYMNGVPSGKVPIVLSNSEKGTASMIMSPVTDGVYGLPITPTEGLLNITKNVNAVVTGNFEGKATNSDKDIFLFKGYFLNVKINPDKI